MTGADLSLRRTSLVQVRIGNKTFDAYFDPRCNTCTHPARMDIEEQIVLGTSYRAISRNFSEIEHQGRDGHIQLLPKVEWYSIRTHFQRGHMPLNQAALREISEKRAKEIGSQYEEKLTSLVDHYTATALIVRKGYERIVRGEIEPDVRETLAAAKLLGEMESASLGSVDSEAWSQAMTIYFETAQALMPPQLWDQFVEKLSTNPILRGLAQKTSQEGDVVDADVVEEFNE